MKEPLLYKIVCPPLTAIFKAIYKPVIVGKRYIPENGRIILAGNHTNILDCILVACATKRCVHYLAKDELMKGAKKYIFGSLGIIPVNRRTKDKAALENAINVLNDEKVIGIFPEGTINRTQDIIMPFKFGAVKMSQESQAKIVPFAITGKYKPFERGVKIQFMEPVDPCEDLEAANNNLMQTVTEKLLAEKKG